MTERIDLKQGETFLLHGQYTEDDGTTPKSLTGVVLTSQVRDKNNKLVADLQITVIDESLGTFTVSTTSTALWTVGQLYFDLKQVVNGVATITNTETINVERAITQS